MLRDKRPRERLFATKSAFKVLLSKRHDAVANNQTLTDHFATLAEWETMTRIYSGNFIVTTLSNVRTTRCFCIVRRSPE